MIASARASLRSMLPAALVKPRKFACRWLAQGVPLRSVAVNINNSHRSHGQQRQGIGSRALDARGAEARGLGLQAGPGGR